MVHRLDEEGVKRGHKRRDSGCQSDLERTTPSCQSSNYVDRNDKAVKQILDNVSQGEAPVCFMANGAMKLTISGDVIPLRDRIRRRMWSWLHQQGVDQRI